MLCHVSNTLVINGSTYSYTVTGSFIGITFCEVFILFDEHYPQNKQKIAL